MKQFQKLWNVKIPEFLLCVCCRFTAIFTHKEIQHYHCEWYSNEDENIK